MFRSPYSASVMAQIVPISGPVAVDTNGDGVADTLAQLVGPAMMQAVDTTGDLCREYDGADAAGFIINGDGVADMNVLLAQPQAPMMQAPMMQAPMMQPQQPMVQQGPVTCRRGHPVTNVGVRNDTWTQRLRDEMTGCRGDSRR